MEIYNILGDLSSFDYRKEVCQRLSKSNDIAQAYAWTGICRLCGLYITVDSTDAEEAFKNASVFIGKIKYIIPILIQQM